MERLSVAGGFDVHDHRGGLKLLRQDAGTYYLENRSGYGCPACGRAFDRLFVSEDREITFDSPPGGPFCLVRTGEQVLLLTHKDPE